MQAHGNIFRTVRGSCEFWWFYTGHAVGVVIDMRGLLALRRLSRSIDSIRCLRACVGQCPL